MTKNDVLRQHFIMLCQRMTTYVYELNRKLLILERRYDPNQPRVPAGDSDGGQWTDTGGGGGRPSMPHTNPTSRFPTTPVAKPLPAAPTAPAAKPLKLRTAVGYLHNHLSPKQFGDGLCATNVANAIRATGIPITPPPIRKDEDAEASWARDYGPSLEAAGFRAVAINGPSGKYPPAGYKPQTVDVAVIQPIAGQSAAGHIAMYDGQQWVSDFRQSRGIWSNRHYEQQGSDYVIYRYPHLE